MPVPASIADLSTTASSNEPDGAEAILPNLDNYLRFHASCIALLRDGASFTDTIRLEGATQGTLGIMAGAGSGGTASGAADDIVIDGAANTGISILSGSSDVGTLNFGDAASATQGRLRYDHATDMLTLWVNGTQRLAVDSSGRMLYGDSITTSYAADDGNVPNVQIQGTSQGTSGIGLYNWSSGASSDPRISLAKSKGAAIGTRGIVADGDELGTIAFSGDDGVGFIRGVLVRAVVDGTPGVNDMPTTLQILVTPDGSDAPALAMQIKTDKSVLPGSDDTQALGSASVRWGDGFIRELRPGAGAVIWTSGAGDPEGSVTAPRGSLYTRTGGSGASLYVKETGSGDTGWVAK